MAAASGITGKATQPLQVAGKRNVQGFHYVTTVQSTSSHRFKLLRTASLRDRFRHLEHLATNEPRKYRQKLRGVTCVGA